MRGFHSRNYFGKRSNEEVGFWKGIGGNRTRHGWLGSVQSWKMNSAAWGGKLDFGWAERKGERRGGNGLDSAQADEEDFYLLFQIN